MSTGYGTPPVQMDRSNRMVDRQMNEQTDRQGRWKDGHLDGQTDRWSALALQASLIVQFC